MRFLRFAPAKTRRTPTQSRKGHSTMTNNVPNLDDSMTADELMAFWAKHQHPGKAVRLELFGSTGEGTIIAAKDLANYASNKATAMQCRERGDIEAALMYEGICDRIYKGLPDFAKW